MWAFDHHTLSRSPEQNARDLVTRLRELNAPRLTVDVLAHSRGGLVARELAALQGDDAPLAIRSITFVATPNEGTPLCDADQLQRFVDRFTNLLAFVPDNPVTDVIDAVGSVAATLALRATEGLVGLRAMDPNGEYLRDLAQRPGNGARYRAITSNFDPTANTKLGDRLRDAAIDKLFGAANDLIVPTASAYGSKERPLVEPENRYEFDMKQGVDHSSFWDKAQFAECIDRWLGLAAPVSVRTLPPDATTQQVVTVDHARDAATEPTEDLDDDDTQTVAVTPVHGSLEHAAHPLIIGHYRGVALDGAGSFLDARLGRKLSTRMMLGRFPEQIGESIIVDNGPSGDEHHGYPPGALVVGLGPPGELTREKLTATLAAAMLRYAIEVFDGQRPHRVDDDGVARLCLSAVPVGTSSAGGISTEACVAALVDALVSVNDQLYRHTAPGRGACWDSVRISALEIVALWEDRAELVAHALNRLPQLLQVDLDTELLQKGVVQHSQHSRLDLCTRLVVREGALRRRPQSEERAGEWQRLIIRNRQRERTLLENVATTPSGAITLEFTAVGGRARADRIDVTLDAAAVELLIASATTEAGPRDQVNRTLYELLLPTQLKQDLFRFDNLQFIVDENTADFPWEALAAGAGRELGIRSGLLRQFQEFEGIRHDVRTPVGDHVLVIGDPPAAPLPSLPGASAEAKTVADVLGRDSFDVKGLIWNDNASIRDDFPNLRGNPGRRILNALFAEEWRVIHVASHGQFDADDSSRSGAVIDKDVFFTANVARQLPVVPELVFLNCCHLGKQDDSLVGPRNPNRLAASVARELMRIGVRAVVAAGWAVDDQPAADFARHFYAELLDGSLLGDAVHIARRRIHNEHAHSMTWGAFQCYGDPSFRLRERERRGIQTRRFVGETLDEHTEIFVSEAELVRRVQTIRAEAGKIGLPGFDELRRAEDDLTAELRRYRQRLDTEECASWATPPVLAEFGAAFGELGRYADAVSCYRVAWADGTSQDVPMRALEQLGNLEIRLAQQLARGDIDAAEVEAALGSHGHSVDDLVASAKSHLQLALQVGVTGERLALIGSFHKKAATLKSGAERTAELERSCALYHQAQLHELERTTADQDSRRVAKLSTYYTHVWLQMAALAGEEVDDSLANALL
ncbi:MAG: CHAT domain-containing protein, partial [Acidimicrobiia bacterium]